MSLISTVPAPHLLPTEEIPALTFEEFANETERPGVSGNISLAQAIGGAIRSPEPTGVGEDWSRAEGPDFETCDCSEGSMLNTAGFFDSLSTSDIPEEECRSPGSSWSEKELTDMDSGLPVKVGSQQMSGNNSDTQAIQHEFSSELPIKESRNKDENSPSEVEKAVANIREEIEGAAIIWELNHTQELPNLVPTTVLEGAGISIEAEGVAGKSEANTQSATKQTDANKGTALKFPNLVPTAILEGAETSIEVEGVVGKSSADIQSPIDQTDANKGTALKAFRPKKIEASDFLNVIKNNDAEKMIEEEIKDPSNAECYLCKMMLPIGDLDAHFNSHLLPAGYKIPGLNMLMKIFHQKKGGYSLKDPDHFAEFREVLKANARLINPGRDCAKKEPPTGAGADDTETERAVESIASPHKEAEEQQQRKPEIETDPLTALQYLVNRDFVPLDFSSVIGTGQPEPKKNVNSVKCFGCPKSFAISTVDNHCRTHLLVPGERTPGLHAIIKTFHEQRFDFQSEGELVRFAWALTWSARRMKLAPVCEKKSISRMVKRKDTSECTQKQEYENIKYSQKGSSASNHFKNQSGDKENTNPHQKKAGNKKRRLNKAQSHESEAKSRRVEHPKLLDPADVHL